MEEIIHDEIIERWNIAKKLSLLHPAMVEEASNGEAAKYTGGMEDCGVLKYTSILGFDRHSNISMQRLREIVKNIDG